MLKVKLLSDLHMEGVPFKYAHSGEGVVILAGDNHTRNRHAELLDQIPSTTRVIAIIGNHELYHGEYYDVIKFFTSLQSAYPNFTFLDSTSTRIGDVEFFGGMMCTDFSLDGEYRKVLAEVDASRGINDFSAASIATPDGTTRQWSTADHRLEHVKFCRELGGWLRVTEGKKRVVISHFAPSPQTVDPKYKMSALNPYFTVDVERFMGWEGVWAFGHTHSSCDMMVGDTRVVANPRGYGRENQHGFNPEFIFEI